MKNKDEATRKEIDEFVVEFRKKSYKLQRMVKEDFVAH